MKILIAMMAGLAGSCACAKAQFQLTAGETFEFQITRDMYQFGGTIPNLFHSFPNFAVKVNYDESTLDAGDSMTWEVLGLTGTLTAASPLASNIGVPWNGLNGAPAPGMTVSTLPEGRVRLTMTSGALVVNDVFVGAGVAAGTPTFPQMDEYTVHVPVPEPGVLALFGLGGVLVPLARCWCRRS